MSIKSRDFRHHLHPKRKKKEREEAKHSLSSSWSLSLYLAWVIGVSRPSLWLSNIHYHVGNLPKDGCVPSTLFNSHLWLFEKIKLGASLCSLLKAQILHRDTQDGACCPQMAMLETDNNKPYVLTGVRKHALNIHSSAKAELTWAVVLLYIPLNNIMTKRG